MMKMKNEKNKNSDFDLFVDPLTSEENTIFPDNRGLNNPDFC